MPAPRVRKPIKTYSRQRKHSLYDEEPPTKRRRIDATPATDEESEILDDIPESPVQSSSPARDVSAMPTSSPKDSTPIFSDGLLDSTPPSSPFRQSSPPVRTRRPMFSFMKRRPIVQTSIMRPLSETSQNVQSPPKPHAKKKRLVQMQLDLVGELRKKCKVCGMEYIPSNSEDAVLHRKFHAMNVGGVDFSKAFVERIKQNEVWAGGDGSFIAAIGRKDTLAFRNKASEVLKVVNTELAAVSIPDEALWSQLHVPIASKAVAHGAQGQTAAKGNRTFSASDRFKVYLYIRGLKCVGACLAERIQEAYSVVDQEDTSDHTGQQAVAAEESHYSSSISIGRDPEPAILGISRIWTSNLHRKAGIATRLLESARSDFLYGMTIEKAMMAFSQPTESGGELARKWFGRRVEWHVYIDTDD
ncbi:hypothetical protein K504DRAFT_508761 [Pleomassaria siparia CBS 279.74]|uniref:Sister chromatid cohesion acetyltransferas-like protein Eco1 n=1 Tax=Pleomassaria siparia CBS 279.74 TaxID=1314801 RepID=A0A6G1JPW9_9PLEO|nr:hypothetical protein K504DRAFT_508761 [Pleomassaria siparia CBS 279.74]